MLHIRIGMAEAWIVTCYVITSAGFIMQTQRWKYTHIVFGLFVH